MLFLLGLVALGGVFLLVLMLAVMHVAGWRLSDARDVALNRAYGSFTHDGEPIPGVRPNALARLVIRMLSTRADPRHELVGSAMRGGPVR